MKRIIIALLFSIILIAGCSEDDSKKTNESAEESEATDVEDQESNTPTDKVETVVNHFLESVKNEEWEQLYETTTNMDVTLEDFVESQKNTVFMTGYTLNSSEVFSIKEVIPEKTYTVKIGMDATQNNQNIKSTVEFNVIKVEDTYLIDSSTMKSLESLTASIEDDGTDSSVESDTDSSADSTSEKEPEIAKGSTKVSADLSHVQPYETTNLIFSNFSLSKQSDGYLLELDIENTNDEYKVAFGWGYYGTSTLVTSNGKYTANFPHMAKLDAGTKQRYSFKFSGSEGTPENLIISDVLLADQMGGNLPRPGSEEEFQISLE